MRTKDLKVVGMTQLSVPVGDKTCVISAVNRHQVAQLQTTAFLLNL